MPFPRFIEFWTNIKVNQSKNYIPVPTHIIEHATQPPHTQLHHKIPHKTYKQHKISDNSGEVSSETIPIFSIRSDSCTIEMLSFLRNCSPFVFRSTYACLPTRKSLFFAKTKIHIISVAFMCLYIPACVMISRIRIMSPFSQCAQLNIPLSSRRRGRGKKISYYWKCCMYVCADCLWAYYFNVSDVNIVLRSRSLVCGWCVWCIYYIQYLFMWWKFFWLFILFLEKILIQC